MNKITGHPAARWLAVVILCLSVLLTAVCLSVPVLMEAYHLNGADPAEMEQRLIAAGETSPCLPSGLDSGTPPFKTGACFRLRFRSKCHLTVFDSLAYNQIIT